MSPWSATITKDKTADGFWMILPGSPFAVGQVVDVDLDSRRTEERQRRSTKQIWRGELINVIDPKNVHGPQMFIPVELLDL